MPDLVDGRVAAATAFWNDEGVQLSHRKPGFHVFRVENYGAPPYPELIVTATRAELRSDPNLARGLVHALVEGYDSVLKDPAAGCAGRRWSRRSAGLSATAVSQQLHAEAAGVSAGRWRQLRRAQARDPQGLGQVGDQKFGIVKQQARTCPRCSTPHSYQSDPRSVGAWLGRTQ